MSHEPLAVRADPPAVLDLPPVHLELAWRPLTPADAPALFDLISTAEEADQAPQRFSADEVVEMFEGDWKDLEKDTLGGFDSSGVLRAYAMTEVRPGDRSTVRAFLRGSVHPEWRGRGIGRAILAWMEGRGRQQLARCGKDLPARLAVFVEENARDQRRLYAAAGFSPIRWYTDMRRDLSVPVPVVELDPTLRVVPWSEELDEQVMHAHNEAFGDHWGSEPHTLESWRQHGSHFMPGWSFVALDSSADNAVVGYVISSRYEQDFAVQGFTCGYTELLGVRAPWRGRKVAAALLARTMQAFADDGMEYACLGVDTANPTGAKGLYAALGYQATHGSIMYSVEI